RARRSARRRPARDLRAGHPLPHRPPARRRLLSGHDTRREPAARPEPVRPPALDAVDAVTALGPLGPEHVDAIAALCRRSLADPPSADEIMATLFVAQQPSTVRGDPDVGVVASAEIDGTGFIRLLVVDPSHRRQGHGHALLEAAEADLAGMPSVTVGTDAPYFLFPGVETTEIGMLVLLERHHY